MTIVGEVWELLEAAELCTRWRRTVLTEKIHKSKMEALVVFSLLFFVLRTRLFSTQ